MLSKILSTILSASLLTVSGAHAQQLLSLEQCRNLAIENNKTLKAATAEEQVAYYQKREAFLQYFPKVSASGTYLHFSEDLHLIGRSSIPTAIPVPAALSPVVGGATSIPIDQSIQDALYEAGRVDLSDYWLLGASVKQPLFMGGKIIALNDIRANAEKLAQTMKETKMADVIVEVDEAYWQVVSLTNKTKLAQSYVDLLTKMDSDVQAMLDEGVATKADRLSVSVKLNEAEMTLTKATNGLSLSKMLLCQLCGLKIGEPIALTDENIDSLPTQDTDMVLTDINAAVANRSEIRSLDYATKIYKGKERVAAADFLPTAGLSLGYNWLKPNLQDGKENKFAGMWNFMFNVSVPLNIFSSSAKLNAAKAETRMQQFQLEDAKDKIVLQINQSSYKLEEANKKYSTALKNSEKADENLRYANVGFEEGVIPASDVLSAHTAWISAHAEMIDAQIDLKLCRVYLDRALGRKF